MGLINASIPTTFRITIWGTGIKGDQMLLWED